MNEIKTGGCLCGAVQYEISGPLRPAVVCHCHQCRKTSGHYVAATQCRQVDVRIKGSGEVKWFRSSEAADRGFCRNCGSNLFWRPIEGEFMSIFAGGLNSPTGIRTELQIHTESAGDYYDIPDIPIVLQTSLKR